MDSSYFSWLSREYWARYQKLDQQKFLLAFKITLDPCFFLHSYSSEKGILQLSSLLKTTKLVFQLFSSHLNYRMLNFLLYIISTFILSPQAPLYNISLYVFSWMCFLPWRSKVLESNSPFFFLGFLLKHSKKVLCYQF